MSDLGNVHAPGSARGPVVIAIVHEGLEVDRGQVGAPQQRVAHVRGVGFGLHPDALLDERLVAGIRPNRGRALEMEALERAVTRGGDRSVRPPVDRQLVRRPAVFDSVLDLRRQERPPERRLQRGHQQAVISPRQRSRHGPGRKPADAVGTQPLAPLGGAEVSRDLAPEVDHQWSLSLRRPPMRSALAMTVSAGFTAALEGKNEASTT